MNNSPLASIMQYTYIRSDFVYKISLLNEFFDFVFFTDHDSVANKEIIEYFANKRKEPQKDIDFLKSLSQEFMERFTHNSFRKVLQDMSDELQRLPVLSITVPVAFSLEHTNAIGEWVREKIASNIILDVSVNSTVSVGCRFVWKNIMHDFSIEHYLKLHEDDLSTQLILSVPQKS